MPRERGKHNVLDNDSSVINKKLSLSFIVTPIAIGGHKSLRFETKGILSAASVSCNTKKIMCYSQHIQTFACH